jgi:hypothetical protein
VAQALAACRKFRLRHGVQVEAYDSVRVNDEHTGRTPYAGELGSLITVHEQREIVPGIPKETGLAKR